MGGIFNERTYQMSNKQNELTLEQQTQLISLGRGKPVAVIDFDAIQRKNNERNAQRDLPKSDPQREYDLLVQKHFDLKQNLRSSENHLNEASGQVHLIEERIAEKVKERDAVESPLGKRYCERAIDQLEFELDAAITNLKKLRRENSQALSDLKSFEVEKLPRLEELRKVVSKK
jgi:septal ring factor EnvC (AmiA/AmiB activator)